MLEIRYHRSLLRQYRSCSYDGDRGVDLYETNPRDSIPVNQEEEKGTGRGPRLLKKACRALYPGSARSSHRLDENGSLV